LKVPFLEKASVIPRIETSILYENAKILPSIPSETTESN